MLKDLYINVRVDELLKEKIDAAATKKGLSSADLIRQILEQQSDLILMDKDALPDRVILDDIWHRVSIIEGAIKIRHQKDSGHLQELREYAEKVKSYVREEHKNQSGYK